MPRPGGSWGPRCSGGGRDTGLVFQRLATLRTDGPLFGDGGELEWRGPTAEFSAWARPMGDPRLLERSMKAAALDT